MAISKKLLKEENDYFTEFKDTYFKIDDVYVNTMKETIRFGIRGYANKEARDNCGIGIYKKNYDVNFADISIANFSKDTILKAGYDYLKTLDEFKNCTNC